MLAPPPHGPFFRRSRDRTPAIAIVPKKSTSPSSTPQANQHASVRRNHATELAEDYVEAIADLIQRQGRCRLVEVAKHFAVSHVTANRAVARLKRLGLVASEPYGPITLTAEGARLAARSKHRHAIVLSFLVSLGVSPTNAVLDAEGIEHHVSDETLRCMETFVKRHSKGSNR